MLPEKTDLEQSSLLGRLILVTYEGLGLPEFSFECKQGPF